MILEAVLSLFSLFIFLSVEFFLHNLSISYVLAVFIIVKHCTVFNSPNILIYNCNIIAFSSDTCHAQT